ADLEFLYRAEARHVAPKHDFRELFQAYHTVQFCFSKISPLQKLKSVYVASILSHQEGRYGQSPRTLGQGAMDASASQGE
ncbi:MAG TPA: hypothetical protein VK734_12135, partial [Bradyrhizobium sp.]|nr:hypothetical protein [Bradyrhizobium sp.]